MEMSSSFRFFTVDQLGRAGGCAHAHSARYVRNSSFKVDIHKQNFIES